MSTQHTPGPWEVCDYELGLKAISTPNIKHYLATEIDAADARLIAAAPDLLAALQAVWEFFEPVYVSAMADDNERTAQDELMDTVRAAIAEATGAA